MERECWESLLVLLFRLFLVVYLFLDIYCFESFILIYLLTCMFMIDTFVLYTRTRTSQI